MPASFILFFLFLIAAILAAVIRRKVTDPFGRSVVGWITVACCALAVIMLAVACFKQVGTKEEGIETSFGKTVGHLSNGPHLTAPWIQVHEMDAAIQTDSFVDTRGGDTICTGIAVRIANQQTGCASVSIQWRIVPNAGDELYKNYRSFNHVRDALVTRNLTAAVNEAFASYNPLDAIVNGASGGTSQQTLVEIAKRITVIMRREIGDRIEILSTILPIVTFDAATQSRINQLQQQVALTRIAQQQLRTNEAQAKANAALAHSVDTSPNVLVAQCMNVLEAMVKQSQPVPAGFSCWPGGGAAAVIAGPTK
jgi:regulator of protease activity HflC (stomatin/prohibitin superfamily)